MVNCCRRFRRSLSSLLVAAVAMHAVSCGALIHPDRIGQPHRGRLDTSIVLLDALGLLLFFVPGVLAFVVDFATGAIYLPAYEYGAKDDPEREGDFVVVRVDPKTLTRERLEEILTEKTGKAVRLDAGTYEARRLQKIDEFRTETEAIARKSSPTEVVFRAQSK